MIRRTSWIDSPCSVPVPQTVLKPLNSLGLWLPVIMTAPLASRCTAEKYSSGVGTTPISVTSQPDSTRPWSSASRSRDELSRQSRPRLMDRPLLRCSSVPSALPRSTISGLCSSVSATPRMSYSRKMVDFSMVLNAHNGPGLCALPSTVTLSADEPIPVDEKSQRPIGTVPDADPRRNADPERLGIFSGADHQRSLGQIRAVVRAGDAQCESQLARTVGQILDPSRAGAPPAHARDPLQRLQSPDQHASRAALRFGNNVEALVHAVDQVDIGMPRLAEDHSRAGCHPTPGMGR